MAQLKDRLTEERVFRNRSFVMMALMIVGCVVLAFRLLQLQVVNFEAYQTRSDANRIQLLTLPPPRGLIYDRNGVVLAENRPIYNLSVVRELVSDFDALVVELDQLIGISETDLQGYIKRRGRRRPYDPVTLKRSLSEEQIATLAVRRHQLPGVVVEAQLVRHYPFGPLLAHALGSVRRITEDDLKKLDPVRYSATQFMGKRGIERFYERSLHGEVGYSQVETDAHGRVRQVLKVEQPQAGKNITLHLDSRLQIAASAALGDRRGAVVAMDTRSGGLLALVSNPGYDPNLFVTGISSEQYQRLVNSRKTPLFNRAINGQYAPGSTFKPVVALAGLSLGALTWDEQIKDPGWYKLPDQERIYRDWNWRKGNAGGQGLVDLNRAIYRSSNVFFYNLAMRLDIDKLAGFAAQFGFGQRWALDIGEASVGLLPNRLWKHGVKGTIWYPGDSINMSIGQGDLLVTPLQLATLASTLANRGQPKRPRMLLASNDVLVESDPLRPLPHVVGPNPEDWERIIDAMENVVHRGNKSYGNNGTAWYHIGRGISYRMAGKSGTAQVVEIKQGEEYDAEELDEYRRKHAWFMAFAPADEPRIAIAVLVENGGGGSSVAAPVAREVLDAYLLPQMVSR